MEVLALMVVAVLGTVVIGSILGIVSAFRVGSLAAELQRVKRTAEDAERLVYDATASFAGRAGPARLEAPVAAVAMPSPAAESVESGEGEPEVLTEAGGEVIEGPPTGQPDGASSRGEQTPEPPPSPVEAVGPPGAAPPPDWRPEHVPPPEPVRSPEPARRPAEKGEAPVEGLESRIGKHWVTWAGAAALFVGAIFFVRFAMVQGWMGPAGRVLLGVLFGSGLVAAGQLFIRRAMRALGQGLTGAGLAVLYAALFAAHGLYGLLPSAVAFGLMAAVTATGMVLAVVQDAKSVAVMAVLGGFATPLLLWNGELLRDPLLGYVLLLDAGVLGVALFKRWRIIDVLAWLGTFGLFSAWLGMSWQGHEVVPATAWLLVFFVVFLCAPFAYHLRTRTRVHGERLFMSVTHGAVVFGHAFALLAPAHDVALGLVALGMASGYGVLALLARRRLPFDKGALWGLLALAMMFATVAVPILFDLHVVTVAWALEGVVLLYLGYRYQSLPERVGAHVVLALAVGHLFAVHWPFHEEPFVPLWNGAFATVLCVAGALAAAWLVHRRSRPISEPADRTMAYGAALCALSLPVAALHLEAWQWAVLAGRAVDAAWIAAPGWILASLALLAAGTRWSSKLLRVTGIVSLSVGTVLVAFHHAAALEHAAELSLGPGPLAVGVLASAAWVAQGLVSRWKPFATLDLEGREAAVLIGAAVTITALVVTFEVVERLAPMGHGATATTVLVGVWALASAVLLGAARRLGSDGLLGWGVVVAAAAGVLATVSYATGSSLGPVAVLNGRFVAALGTVALPFAYGAALLVRSRTDPEGGALAVGFLGLGATLLLAALSAEVYLHCLTDVPDPVQARWVAQMSLTIVWGAFAAALLAVGFWKRIPQIRIAGLVLFALTAAKLVLVDVANVRDLYRVFSFLAVGALLIGASYLYHRLERRLRTVSSD